MLRVTAAARTGNLTEPYSFNVKSTQIACSDGSGKRGEIAIYIWIQILKRHHFFLSYLGNIVYLEYWTVNSVFPTFYYFLSYPAPSKCLQYFTSRSGTVTSFNWSAGAPPRAYPTNQVWELKMVFFKLGIVIASLKTYFFAQHFPAPFHQRPKETCEQACIHIILKDVSTTWNLVIKSGGKNKAHIGRTLLTIHSGGGNGISPFSLRLLDLTNEMQAVSF